MEVTIAVIAIILLIGIFAWEMYDDKHEKTSKYRPRLQNTITVVVVCIVISTAVICSFGHCPNEIPVDGQEVSCACGIGSLM